MDKYELRRIIVEVIEEMKMCSECGAMYEAGTVHECGMYEDAGSDEELDEFSGAGAVAGYTLPLGMRPSGPRRDMSDIAHRSFGGLSGKRRKHRKH